MSCSPLAEMKSAPIGGVIFILPGIYPSSTDLHALDLVGCGPPAEEGWFLFIPVSWAAGTEGDK